MTTMTNFNFNSLINSETLLPENRLLRPPLLGPGKTAKETPPVEKIGTANNHPSKIQAKLKTRSG